MFSNLGLIAVSKLLSFVTKHLTYSNRMWEKKIGFYLKDSIILGSEYLFCVFLFVTNLHVSLFT